MRKLSGLIAVIICIMSCSKDMTEIPENGSCIVVKTSVDTKAGYEGTTVLPEKFIIDINQGVEDKYNYSLVKMDREPGVNTYVTSDKSSLRWASDDHSKAVIKAMTIPHNLDKVDGSESMNVTVLKDQTSEENVKMSDLLGASSESGITIKDDDINILFNHLMSKLYVTYSYKNDLNNKNVKVNSLILENTCVSSSYNYANMKFDDAINKSFGDVKLYHNNTEKVAECIFCPYVPTEYPILSIELTIDDEKVKFNIPVALKSAGGFVGNKRYKMNIKISGTGVEETDVVMVNDWTESKNSDTLEDARILWIGTSIPAGDPNNNYPKMVSDKTGLYIRNNSIGGSFVAYHINNPVTTWANKTVAEIEAEIAHGFSLSATFEEIEAKYRPYLQANPNVTKEETEACLELFKSCSYQSIILPYINGSEDNCNVIVLDHGFNDYYNILHECRLNNDFNGVDNYNKVVAEENLAGYQWIKGLAEDKNPVYNDYGGEFTMGKKSYFQAMEFVINECRKVNPDIKIIIGNYFARKNPHYIYNLSTTDGSLCTELILHANQAVANIHGLDIVNVYEYTGLDEFTGLDTVIDCYNFNLFANDMIHPHAGGNTMSNKIIANAYAEELGRILSK